jgi:predicted permease
LSTIQPPGSDLYTFRLAAGNDTRVWIFTLAVTLASSFLFGVLPAWKMARADCMQEVRGQDRAGRPRLAGQNALVAIQVCLSLVMLVTAAIFLRSLGRTAQVSPGFATENGIIVPLNLNLATYAGNEAKGRAFFRTVEERIGALAGVRECSLLSYVPLSFDPTTTVRLGTADPLTVSINLVEPAYLSVMNRTLLSGRNFSAADDASSQRVALIDSRLALALWPDANPSAAVGRAIRVGDEKEAVQIAGIVSAVPGRSLTDTPRPALLLPAAQRYSTVMNLAVRTREKPEALLEPIRREVAAVDDVVSLRRMRTMKSLVADALWPLRVGSRAILSLGFLALVLAVAGIYGVIVYSVSRRTREIGIRLAVGATGGDVVALIARHALSVTGWGIAAGLPLCVGGNFLLARFLFGVRPVEPDLIAGMAALWLAVSLAACAAPALRALKDGPASIRELG